MSRVRQAHRCHARRSDGEPCRGWAVLGADVCRAHGGAAGQVREAAQRRVTEDQARRAMNASIERHAREYREWQARRIATASELLGMPTEDFIGPDGRVIEALLSWCHLQHGRPAGLETAPKPRLDRRFAATRQAQPNTAVETAS